MSNNTNCFLFAFSSFSLLNVRRTVIYLDIPNLGGRECKKFYSGNNLQNCKNFLTIRSQSAEEKKKKKTTQHIVIVQFKFN